MPTNRYATALAAAMEAKPIKISELARHIGTSPSYVSQCKAGKLALTDSYAERVAAVLGVAPEDISEQYARKKKAGAALERMGLRPQDSEPGHVRLDLLPNFGPAVDELTHVILPQAMVQRKIGFTAIERIRCAFNPTRAMAPEIEHGALLLLDTTARRVGDIVDGMVYAYQLYGHADVRRFLLNRQQLQVAGNGDDTTRLTEEDLAQLKILGLVVAHF